MLEFLKVTEVAKLMRVSKATVQRWCAEGKLPAFKIGQQWRIRGSALRDMIDAATESAADFEQVAKLAENE